MVASYPPQVHELYRSAVADLWSKLCRGEIFMAEAGSILPVSCRAGCTDHVIEVNERTLRRLVMDVNAAAHGLVKSDFVHLPDAQRRALHAEMLNLSRSYFDFFDELRADKVRAHRQKHRADRTHQRRTKNQAIELDVAAGQVDPSLLLEFAACYRKHRYGSEAEAAAGLIANAPESDGSYQIYACDYCGEWHVGHRMGKTAPRYYRVTRAQMLWSTNRKLANRFVRERQLAGG